MSRLVFAALLSTLLLSRGHVFAQESADSACVSPEGSGIWVSPRIPRPGDELRIMAVSTQGPLREITLEDTAGNISTLEGSRRGGPPWSIAAQTRTLRAGSYRLRADGGTGPCLSFRVGDGLPADGGGNVWDLATEGFYSAWIEQLFDAPAEENLSFPSLEPVLRNPERNFLHGYLGLGEDKGLPATPDCADLPYFLRSYFAWKLGLPMAYRACSRGSSAAPPRCGPARIVREFARGPLGQAGFRVVSRQLADGVHSGSARTALNDEASDFYPVELSRETLWPGTVYADPYGHVLVLTQWIPQTATQPGLLLGVDAQPDNSVARKRFWQGTFLYANPIASAGPGFKAFRPLLGTPGGLRPASNSELMDADEALPISLEQKALDAEAFYARMQSLINPKGLPPRRAYEAMLDALMEQLETRITSVENGEAYFRKNPGATIPMPDGAAIFETVGPWEDYSTPSRDMRLLIAMKVLQGMPQHLREHPELYALEGASPDGAAEELEAYHAARAEERSITYTRSDGGRQRLSLGELLERKSALEMAYNPNDCVEVRWGARPGSPEYGSCRRRAPAAQTARMEKCRSWFRDARRPPR
jgi:hypothetical protein